jgi:CheY-like chemotaxis protein
MPLVNGYEAAEKIRSLEREDAKSISIIAMTADAFKAAQDKSEAVGMDDYITKPLSQSALLEALLRACRKYLLTN